MSSAGNGLSTQASLSDRIASPRPPHRLERLKELMAEGQLDGVVALGADHATHLAGYSRYNGGPCAVVVDRTGERTLVVMGAEVESAEAGSEAETVRRFGGPDIPLVLDFAPLLATGVASLPRIAGARRLGFADGLGGIEAELSRELAAELVPMEEPLDELRAVKDEDELGRILRAYELCWIAQREVGRAAAAGETEIGAFSAAHAAAQVAHERPIEFNSDLLSGAASGLACSPWYVPGPRRIVDGDPVLADIVVRADGYWGDSAETHIAGSNPAVESARKELLDILAYSGSLLTSGTAAADVYGAMRERILSTFPGGEFPHHGGHALGLGFDRPKIIPADAMQLESWMVIALEPGVYFPGEWGVRVENLFVVTPAGGVELRDAMGVR